MTTRRFFIAGAFKSGTTALASYLRTHPQVAMSQPKEPYYFATDFPKLRKATTAVEYERLFGRREGAAWCGEASAGYLYSRVAIENLRAFAPDSKVIVLLRRPDELVVAFHGELLYARDERYDFAKAWRLEASRQEGRHIPRRCRTPEFLRYREVGCIGKQLERLLERVPRAQVQIHLFDDLRRDPATVYRETLRFLELPDDGRDEFPVVNPHKRHRLAPLGNWTQRPPSLAVSASRWLKSVAGLQRLGVLDAVRRWNVPPRPRRALPRALAQEVHETFLPEVERLERLLGRDLSAWRALP